MERPVSRPALPGLPSRRYEVLRQPTLSQPARFVSQSSFLFECLQVVVGTKVGRPKHMRIMPGGALEADQEAKSVFVGRKLDEHRGAFLLEYPMDKGAVVDNGWDAMEALWQVCGFWSQHDCFTH